MNDEHYIDGEHNGGVYNSGNLASYSYTYGNPIKYIDPNGKQNISASIKGVGIQIERAFNSSVQYTIQKTNEIKGVIIFSPPGQIIGSTKDFVQEYSEMRERNIIGNDHYHHATANSKAAQRGKYGEATAKIISDIRETFDYVKGDTRRDIREDQIANKHGRSIPDNESPSEWNSKYDQTKGGSRAEAPSRSDNNQTLKQDIKDFINNMLPSAESNDE